MTDDDFLGELLYLDLKSFLSSIKNLYVNEEVSHSRDRWISLSFTNTIRFLWLSSFETMRELQRDPVGVHDTFL